jgi:hypothetical protein
MSCPLATGRAEVPFALEQAATMPSAGSISREALSFLGLHRVHVHRSPAASAAGGDLRDQLHGASHAHVHMLAQVD